MGPTGTGRQTLTPCLTARECKCTRSGFSGLFELVRGATSYATGMTRMNNNEKSLEQRDCKIKMDILLMDPFEPFTVLRQIVVSKPS
jgi:hypothetical protein